MKMFWSANSVLYSRIFVFQTCRCLLLLAAWSRPGWQAGFRQTAVSHATHLVGLVLFHVALDDRQHDGTAQKHGEFTAEEVVVVQKVAAYAYVEQSLVR